MAFVDLLTPQIIDLPLAEDAEVRFPNTIAPSITRLNITQRRMIWAALTGINSICRTEFKRLHPVTERVDDVIPNNPSLTFTLTDFCKIFKLKKNNVLPQLKEALLTMLDQKIEIPQEGGFKIINLLESVGVSEDKIEIVFTKSAIRELLTYANYTKYPLAICHFRSPITWKVFDICATVANWPGRGHNRVMNMGTPSQLAATFAAPASCNPMTNYGNFKARYLDQINIDELKAAGIRNFQCIELVSPGSKAITKIQFKFSVSRSLKKAGEVKSGPLFDIAKEAFAEYRKKKNYVSEDEAKALLKDAKYKYRTACLDWEKRKENIEILGTEISGIEPSQVDGKIYQPSFRYSVGSD